MPVRVPWVPGALLSVKEMSLSAYPALIIWLGANVFVNATSMTPRPVVKVASAPSASPPWLPDALKLIVVACAATLKASTVALARIERDLDFDI
jgi:hypothetical protein